MRMFYDIDAQTIVPESDVREVFSSLPILDRFDFDNNVENYIDHLIDSGKCIEEKMPDGFRYRNPRTCDIEELYNLISEKYYSRTLNMSGGYIDGILETIDFIMGRNTLVYDGNSIDFEYEWRETK